VPSATDAREMRERRFLALGATLAAVLFCGVVIGVLVGTWLSGDALIQDSPTLETLRGLLAKGAAGQEVQDAIREEDVRLRRAHFTRQRRLRWGGCLLFAGLVVVVICAHWYASLDPKTAMPTSPADRSDEERWLAGRRVALAGAGAVAAILGVTLVAMGVAGGSRFAEKEGPAAGTQPAPAGQTPAEQDSGPADTNAGSSVPQPTVAAEHFKENWPRFRGPTGMGIVPAGDWPREWDGSTGRNILWQTAIPGPGHSSPVIWANRIFVTVGDSEKREVVCLDRATGRLLWRTAVPSLAKKKTDDDEEEDEEPTEETGYAAPTPATDGKRIYAVFATADIAALDFDGKIVWAQNLGRPANTYGMATSLLTYKNLVIFQFDRGFDDDDLSAILALDGNTGKTDWRSQRKVPCSWSTPVVVETESGPELITCAAPWIISYDPEFGGELWRASGLSGDVAPAPVYANGVVFVTSEYAQVMAIRAGGSGDVTETDVLWTAEEGTSDASSPVCDGRFFLQAHSSGLVTCYDAKVGKMLWEQELDAEFWASPTLVGKLVYLPDAKGRTYIFELADKYKLLSVQDLGEPISATPAFADSQIYIRGEKRLFCIGKK